MPCRRLAAGGQRCGTPAPQYLKAPPLLLHSRAVTAKAGSASGSGGSPTMTSRPSVRSRLRYAARSCGAAGVQGIRCRGGAMTWQQAEARAQLAPARLGGAAPLLASTQPMLGAACGEPCLRTADTVDDSVQAGGRRLHLPRLLADLSGGGGQQQGQRRRKNASARQHACKCKRPRLRARPAAAAAVARRPACLTDPLPSALARTMKWAAPRRSRASPRLPGEVEMTVTCLGAHGAVGGKGGRGAGRGGEGAG